MAEIFVSDGSWTFDGEHLRIVPGSGKDVHELRKVLGELMVPLEAIAADDHDDHDVLIRRLSDLGELHRSGVLTDEEFSTAKQALLRRLQ
ncbi:SHOCT domain-containing protein [Sphaerimonospora cavernae]|uniref:SHOCT domain-containing protein n=1 Tax=Sphaerimonospora cavernae TaxID=1740611 RepID=A0ABV6U1H4_9ACTN